MKKPPDYPPIAVALAVWGLGAALYLVDLPGIVKMLLNIAATTIVCLATYQWFVRRTWVSVLLNGKRHLPNQPMAVQAA